MRVRWSCARDSDSDSDNSSSDEGSGSSDGDSDSDSGEEGRNGEAGTGDRKRARSSHRSKRRSRESADSKDYEKDRKLKKVCHGSSGGVGGGGSVCCVVPSGWNHIDSVPFLLYHLNSRTRLGHPANAFLRHGLRLVDLYEVRRIWGWYFCAVVPRWRYRYPASRYLVG